MLTMTKVPGIAAREDGKIWSVEYQCFLPQSIDSDGYMNVHVHSQYWRVHRLVAETFLPNPENLPEVDHINHDRSDNRIENLRWISRLDNMRNLERGNKSVKIIYPDGKEEEYINYAAAAEALDVNRSTIKRAVDDNRPLKNGIRIEKIDDIGEVNG